MDLMIVIPSINQLNLYGYKSYFDLFFNLFNKGKFPNRIIFSGQKGIGKATFTYHLINYLLSINEKTKYSLSNYSIDDTNATYKKMINNIHPNFFLLDLKSPPYSCSPFSPSKINLILNLLAIWSGKFT